MPQRVIESPETWKDGELSYLRRLLASGGSADVPPNAVASYLDCQAASARRDGLEMLARSLELARDAWADRDYVWARLMLCSPLRTN